MALIRPVEGKWPKFGENCYLAENAYLPMVYTDDAIDGTIKLMEAPK